jgi:hypothetical protein
MRRPQLGPSPHRNYLAVLQSRSFLSFALLACAMLVACSVGAQSVADAAKRAREQKKQEPTTGKVWTNENVPTTGNGISVVGEAPAPAASESAEKSGDATAADKTKTPPATKAATPEEVAKKRADLQAQLEEARKEQERLEKELDLAKRDLDLQTQQAYTNPQAMSDGSAQTQIAPYRAVIDSKSAELDAAKAKIAELQKQLDELLQPKTDPQQ